MDYVNVPTTVFTPIEYGCIGHSEEDAIAKYGEDDIEVYHTNFRPLEWTVAQREENACYAKLICVQSLNVSCVVTRRFLRPNVMCRCRLPSEVLACALFLRTRVNM